MSLPATKANLSRSKKGRKGRRRKLKGVRGRGTLAKEKPPIFGMIQRGGEVVLQMLANVQQKTIKPVIQATVSAGTRIYTDEYDIYARLEAWGYGHKSVCHSAGEYARDDDDDGFCEVHVNTMEGFGHCCVLGSDPIVASPKRSYRSILISSSSFIMLGKEVKPCWIAD